MKQESKTKIRNKFFRWSLFLLFVAFVTLYLSQATGYYEYEQSRKTAFTEEQIKQFEQDVKDGKEIDINNYLENTNKDYQNNISKVTLNVSEAISKYMKYGIEKMFEGIVKVIEE
ncbi:MAG: hypothetical protein E7165_04245 [Firmicutes bacterium]|nr:hypothetical protein [Bacillota bacterium]